MGKLIIPKTYVKELFAPLVFLLGPIGSAPNWQDDAVRLLFSRNPDLIIASPKQGVREGIAQYIAPGDETHFARQREWERHYQDIASRAGALLFWLPGEEKHDCSKVYGAMTRLELGMWLANYRHDNSVRFCIGTDGRFPEMRTIEYDLSLDAPGKTVYKTLEETCAEAVRLASKGQGS